MNCEWVKENVILYVYDELADDSRIEMEQHAEHCPACAQEITAARGFHQEMSSRPQLEVSPNFLAASRMRLSEALERPSNRSGASGSSIPASGCGRCVSPPL